MRVNVGDGKLFFDVEGAKLVPDGPQMRERPTLVLLHGGPGFDHSIWKPDMSPLAEVAQIVYLDHRSMGRSDRTGGERWTLDHWGDDVRAFCEALEIEKPIVMGTSFGGFVALAYATRHPDHPGKLVFCSTSARWQVARVLDAFEKLGGAAARDAAQRYWEKPSTETVPDYLRICMPLYNRVAMGPEVMSRALFNYEVLFHFGRGAQQNFDFTAGLARIKCPTLVMGGDIDPITPIQDQADIAAALPRDLVRFERFAGAGHAVVPDEPARFLQVLREFIAA
ncbi:MAG: alpha/beta fold hydrolase [Candidatus Binataceae bacterium]